MSFRMGKTAGVAIVLLLLYIATNVVVTTRFVATNYRPHWYSPGGNICA
jgi:hypothetical protein